MTPSMQSTLRKLSAEDLRAKYRVSRSDEPGTTGLFKLVKKSNDDAAVPVGRGRPVSLNLPKGQEGAFLGLKSSATPRSFLGFVSAQKLGKRELSSMHTPAHAQVRHAKRWQLSCGFSIGPPLHYSYKNRLTMRSALEV